MRQTTLLVLSDSLEISDLIVAYDSDTLARKPVRAERVLDYFSERRNRTAMRIVRALPLDGEYLNAQAVDDLLLRSHLELQRLNEEMLHGERVLQLLKPILNALRAAKVPPPWRIVDIGCGLGYVIRWLTLRGGLGPEVKLVGVDYNEGLVNCAKRSAEFEGLRCDFSVANAFKLDQPATIYLSSGVLHHFRGAGLQEFFAKQDSAQVFLHFDILPTWLAPIGAWIFHQARMRVAMARHDGVLSARRAHSSSTLLNAARTGCPHLRVGIYDGIVKKLPLTHIFHSVVGMTPSLEPACRAQLGKSASRLGTME